MVKGKMVISWTEMIIAIVVVSLISIVFATLFYIPWKLFLMCLVVFILVLLIFAAKWYKKHPIYKA